MDNKYYHPSIEEFHVGFEYEYRNHDGTVKNNTVLNYWNKSTISDLNELSYVERGLQTPNNTRVKYLDKDDIESLGFEGQSTNKTYYKRDGYRLVYWPNDTIWVTSIYKIYGPNDEVKIFDGIIKNKSELARLLKQLNIQ